MLSFRKAVPADSLIYYDWANDPVVRAQSYNSILIDFESHEKWFKSKLEDDLCLLLIFQNQEMNNIGQVRIQKENEKEALIGISVAGEYRGKGYATEMLENALEYFLKSNPDFSINAYIKQANQGSKRTFEKAGFKFKEIINYNNCDSYHFIKSRI